MRSSNSSCVFGCMKGGTCAVKLEQIQTNLEQWRLIFRASVVRPHSETLIKTSEAGGNK